MLDFANLDYYTEHDGPKDLNDNRGTLLSMFSFVYSRTAVRKASNKFHWANLQHFIRHVSRKGQICQRRYPPKLLSRSAFNRRDHDSSG